MLRIVWTAAIILGLGISSPVTAQLKIYGDANKRQIHSQQKLTKVQKRAFHNQRRRATYFGAMFIQPGSDVFAAVDGFHHLGIAESFAEIGCRLQIKEGAAPCILLSTIVPRSYTAKARGKVTLSENASRSFRRRYLKNQWSGHFSAFAISPLHHYGLSFGKDTEQEALNAALKSCNERLSYSLERSSPGLRSWLESSGFAKCLVADSRKAGG